MRRFFQYLIALGAVTGLFFEIFFRLVLPAPDHPSTRYDTHYKVRLYDSTRHTSGIYTFGRKAEIKGAWKVNNRGWVSAVPFKPVSQRKRPMIAIIGDSYVENLYCDIEDHLDRYLERELGGVYTVYAFGSSGCNLAQFIYVSRYVRETFQPAMIIYLVNHRNLRESLTSVKRDRNQLQYVPEEDGLKRMEPKQILPSRTVRLLSQSAAYRYLRTNLEIRLPPPNLRPWEPASEAVQGDADHPSEEMRSLMAAVADSVLRQLSKEHDGVPALFALHPFRTSIYAGDEPLRQTPDQEILKEVLQRYNQSYLDMNPYFNETWKREGRKFEFSANEHWDPYGNEVAAKALAKALRVSFAARQQTPSDSAPASERLN